jgi:hypothetical protein
MRSTKNRPTIDALDMPGVHVLLNYLSTVTPSTTFVLLPRWNTPHKKQVKLQVCVSYLCYF